MLVRGTGERPVRSRPISDSSQPATAPAVVAIDDPGRARESSETAQAVPGSCAAAPDSGSCVRSGDQRTAGCNHPTWPCHGRTGTPQVLPCGRGKFLVPNVGHARLRLRCGLSGSASSIAGFSRAPVTAESRDTWAMIAASATDMASASCIRCGNAVAERSAAAREDLAWFRNAERREHPRSRRGAGSALAGPCAVQPNRPLFRSSKWTSGTPMSQRPGASSAKPWTLDLCGHLPA